MDMTYTPPSAPPAVVQQPGAQHPGVQHPGVQHPGVQYPGVQHAYGQGGHMVLPPTVATQQPQSVVNTTTVIVNQPVQRPMMERDWTSGLCSCCNDIESCMCALLCASCYLCHISETMDEGWCMPCCHLPGTALAMLRLKLRIQESISGSIGDDLCCSAYCFPFVLCQLKRELDVVRQRRDAVNQLRIN